MKQSILLLLLLGWSSALAQAPARAGKDYAVFFYVTTFRQGWAALPETEVETKALKTELENNFGFACELVANPTKQQMRQKIREYNVRLTANDQVLYFFSMHGLYSATDDRGYLVGKDGQAKDEYGDSWLSYDELRTDLAPCKAKHVLLALDACHSGSFGIRNKGRPDVPIYGQEEDCASKINKTMQYSSRQYCTSGNKEAKTPAKSLFAQRFLEALRKGGDNNIMRFDDLEYWLGKVENPKPECGTFVGHEAGGDFVFVRKTACIKKGNDSAQVRQEVQSIVPVQNAILSRYLCGVYPFGINGAMRLGQTFNDHFLKSSNISDLPETIIPEFYNYQRDSIFRTVEVNRFSYAGGLFVNRRWSKFPWISLQADLIFSRQSGGYDYNDITGLFYTIRFNYWYSTFLLSSKFRPGAKVEKGRENLLGGFFGRIGLFAGFNLSPNNIEYIQWPEATFGMSKNVEDLLKEVLKGRPNFGLFCGIGYEFYLANIGDMLSLELRYHHGTSDVIYVEDNGYGFRNNNNYIRSLEITIGIGFSF